MITLEPERMFFHCLAEPNVYWWDRVRAWEGWTDEGAEKKGMVGIWQAREDSIDRASGEACAACE